MMIGRIVPLLLATGTMAVAAKEGPATISKVKNAVTSMVQRTEIQTFVRQLAADAALDSSIPQPGDARGLTSWLKDAVAAGGGRDPALDHWDTPYLLEKTDEPDHLRLLSRGGNSERDVCVKGVSLSGEQDDICEEFEVPRGALRPRRRGY